METKSIPVLFHVSDEEFLDYTYAWRSTEKSEDWLDYFFINNKVIPGYYIYPEHLMELLSVPGVITIKIRFGLLKNHLVLLMFGTDNADERRTHYLGVNALNSSTSSEESAGKNESKGGIIEEISSGNVPDALADRWIKNWSIVQPTKSNIPGHIHIKKDFFITHYGLLQGYNYSAKEIRETLYKKPNGIFPKVQIKFALHKYLYFDPTVYDKSRKEKLTFGIIFHAVNNIDNSTRSEIILGHVDSNGRDGLTSSSGEKKSIRIKLDGDDESVFYDLSMPCPRTC